MKTIITLTAALWVLPAAANTDVSITVTYNAKAFADASLPVPTVHINHAKPKTLEQSEAPATALPSEDYTVVKGDTVFEIMRNTGMYWKDIIKLNNLQAPYALKVGDTLRITRSLPAESLPAPTPPPMLDPRLFGAIDFQPVVDKWWGTDYRLQTVSSKQLKIFRTISKVQDTSMRELLLQKAYIESVYGAYGKCKHMQKRPCGLFQFDKATAKKHGLIKGSKDYRNDTARNIQAAIKLQQEVDADLVAHGMPDVNLWRYLRHQQGKSGGPNLWRVFNGDQATFSYKMWNGKTGNTRKNVLNNLTKRLGTNPTVTALTDPQLALYNIGHWSAVMEKAEEAVTLMRTKL